MGVECPFCGQPFEQPGDWCPHFIGLQADLTLDDYKDFLSGEFPAETADDGQGNVFYFLNRGE